MNLTLLGANVVIRPDTLPDLSMGGIALPNGGAPSTLHGVVLATGNGPSYLDKEVRRVLADVKERLKRLGAVGFMLNDVEQVQQSLRYAHTVQPGDRVIFSPGTGQELVFERELLIVMAEDDILAIVE